MLYYIYKAITVPFKMLLAYTSMLSVRSKKIFVFGAWDGNKFADNPKYLYLEALKNPNIRPIWITGNRDIYKQLRYLNFPVQKDRSLIGIYYQLRAGVCVVCSHPGDVLIYLLGNAVQINLWHGVSLKKVVFDDHISGMMTNPTNTFLFNLRNLIYEVPFSKEFVASTSEAMSKIYLSAFRKKEDKILQLGQPRNDVFFDDYFEVEPFEFKDKYSKIFLYMPTHRNSGNIKIELSKIFDLHELNSYLVEHDILFLVKKHYYHRLDLEGDLINYSNIKDITNQEWDSQVLLKYADLLISDYSSCYIDYLLLDRPIIFYNYDFEAYLLNDRELYFPYDDVTPGPKVSTFHEFMNALMTSFNDQEDSYRSQRTKIRDLFYSKENQGPTGAKMLSYIVDNILDKA